jgi:protein CpxP
MRQMFQSSVMIIALAAAGSVAAFAQAPQTAPQTPDQPQQTRPQHRQFEHHGPNPEFETRMLTRRLNLTPEQAAQVEPILAASHESMKALKPADGSRPDFKAMHEQRTAIATETKQKLDAVLTPEQQEKFARMHEHMGHGGPHGNFGPKPASTPTA